MEDIIAVSIPIFVSVVLPVSIVLIVAIFKIKSDNQRAQVLIKAIEANNNIDADKLAECCGDTAHADDIAQESYVKAYLSCDGFKDPTKFNAWIYRIGYTTFIDSRRSARQFADIADAHAIAAENATDEAFRYQALYAALGQLPPKERSSVLLYYLEGYSIKEIADIESVTQDAVKQHLSRGRNHLRDLLSNT